MSHFIELLKAWGPAGAFLLAVLDSAGVPIPFGLEALLVSTAIQHPQAAYLSAGMAVVGSLVGSLVLFSIARKGGELYLSKYTASPRGAKLRHWFLEYGLLTVLIPAMLPIPMPLKLFELCAGALGVGVLSFLAVILAARIVRYFGLAYLGLHLGPGTLPYLRRNWPMFLAIAAGLFLVLFVLIRVFDRRHKLERLAAE